MPVPNIFGSATAAIPLSQLDTNFATAITLGNTAVYLGNTTTSLGNVTLTNVTISSGNVNGTVGATTASTGAFTSVDYTTTLTGGTGIVNLGSGQFYKDASGNVGIGTNSPDAKLHVITSTEGQSVIFQNNNTNINANNAFGYLIKEGVTTVGKFRSVRDGSGKLELLNAIAGPLAFGTNDTERARISSDGTFRVKGAGTAGSTDAFQVAGGAPADAARIDSLGNLLVGTTSASALSLNTKFTASDVSGGKASLGSVIGSGSAAIDTKIPINQFNQGGTIILIASRNTSAGLNTASAVYLVQFFYDGNNAPATTFIAGSNFVTFGVSGSQTLTVTNSGGGNATYAWFGNK